MPAPGNSPFLGLVGRLLWMFIGPVILMVAIYTIVIRGGGWFTSADVVYLSVLAVTLVGRCMEFTFGDPKTAEGEPATVGHLQRYILVALVAGLGVWVVANILGNHVLLG